MRARTSEAGGLIGVWTGERGGANVAVSPARYDKLQAEIKGWRATTLANLSVALESGVEAQQSMQVKCSALERERNQLLAGGQSGQSTPLKLVPGLTKVVNAHSTELIIGPTAGTGVEKHCCDGGAWDATYSFAVPQAIVPGTKAPVKVGIQVSRVKPEQPLGFQITVLAPDFAQSYSIEYPHPAGGSTTFDIPISAAYSSAKEYTITIGFNSSSMTYTYQP